MVPKVFWCVLSKKWFCNSCQVKTEFRIESISYEKMETILPLVSLLNEGRFEYPILKERLDDMLSRGNYQCIGVYRENELIGICGFWLLNKLYAGKHLEPDNVYVKSEYRNKGIGNLMMQWLFDYAKQLDCEGLEVNCYIKNIKGKKFWESQGFNALGYHMIKKF